MDIKEKLESMLSGAKMELFSSGIDQIISKYYDYPPNNLEPKKIWQNRVRKELMEGISLQDSINRTAIGFDAIASDLKLHLCAKDFEMITDEWEHGVEKWIINNSNPVNTDAVQKDTLFEILGLSPELLTHFYEAGARYFEAKDFEKAADVFYAVSSLEPRLTNVWISLGLSEVHLDRWEMALVAFSFASIIDDKSPSPYLYSAECCLKDGRKEEAKIYLNLADEAIQDYSEEGKVGFEGLYKKLLNEVGE